MGIKHGTTFPAGREGQLQAPFHRTPKYGYLHVLYLVMLNLWKTQETGLVVRRIFTILMGTIRRKTGPVFQHFSATTYMHCIQHGAPPPPFFRKHEGLALKSKNMK
jgi:hypothetical protein